MTTVHAEEWTLQARCAGMGDALFPEPARQPDVVGVCQDCPVRLHCLAEALDHRLEYGVWGGMTERQRRALLRRNPRVSSWRAQLGLVARRSRRPDPTERAARLATAARTTIGC